MDLPADLSRRVTLLNAECAIGLAKCSDAVWTKLAKDILRETERLQPER